MKKHLLIHGDPRSGKSLLIKNLLNSITVFKINCKDPFILSTNFFWSYGSEEKQVLHFEDINKSTDPREFIFYTGFIPVDTQGHEVFAINPRLIIEYSNEIEIPKEHSFIRRFHVVNTNTISYREIISLIHKWNENTWNN